MRKCDEQWCDVYINCEDEQQKKRRMKAFQFIQKNAIKENNGLGITNRMHITLLGYQLCSLFNISSQTTVKLIHEETDGILWGRIYAWTFTFFSAHAPHSIHEIGLDRHLCLIAIHSVHSVWYWTSSGAHDFYFKANINPVILNREFKCSTRRKKKW